MVCIQMMELSSIVRLRTLLHKILQESPLMYCWPEKIGAYNLCKSPKRPQPSDLCKVIDNDEYLWLIWEMFMDEKR